MDVRKNNRYYEDVIRRRMIDVTRMCLERRMVDVTRMGVERR